MRFLPTLVLTLTLLPLAAAKPDLPDPRDVFDGGEASVGPCAVGWGFLWPGRLVAAGCWTDKGEVAYAGFGTAALGYACTVRAAGATLFTCPSGAPWEWSVPIGLP